MNYKDVIESKYDREAWQQLLHDIFLNKVSFWSTPYAVNASSRIAKQALCLGKITLADGESLAIYEVELADKVDIERNKRGIRDLLATDWRSMGYAGAFMFCFRKDESILRFSYVSETWHFTPDGNYEKTSTNTRRYTYLLGEGRGCRTAIEQFDVLKHSNQTLKDITAAFSVESLTQQFYKDLFEWFQWASAPESCITFPNDTSTEDDDMDDRETKIIRMITRIMFVWFIKQEDLVPDKIFDTTYLQSILKDIDPYSTTVGNYYNAILQNLFFATLNRAIEDEDGNRRAFAKGTRKDIKTLYRYAEMFSISEEQVIDLFSEVPFLNGGLFECLDKTKQIDGVEKAYNYDGFSRNDSRFADGRYRNRAVVPNVFFFEPEKGLISILSRYNFTIEENSPEEQQVALDPELLGKVFENLLGAYNPETKETARNQSGSFYTPREIVNYMVDESLIAYLGDSDFIRSLFDSNFNYDKTKAEEYADVTARLKAIKILDPACGSGAFPMGLLNRMVDILSHISPNEDVYDLKLAIIENCIYGSDIQCIAAQITKLRFFISLICNCKKDASKPNFGIPTLPNLETKFVAANSLIGIKKVDTGNLFADENIEHTKKAIQNVRHEHFIAKTARRKKELRKKDQELREKLAMLLEHNEDYAPEDAKQLAAWNPYDQNETADFFDPKWMFGVEDGFDLVISNPPYIQLQNNGGALAELYAPCGFKTYNRRGDIYCLFYERGYDLLKPNGHLCYITSNKWMRAGYGENTRGFFAKRTNPLLLIDFAGVKIFESATVDTNILLFAKSANEHNTLCAVTNKHNKDSVKKLSLFVQQEGVRCSFFSSDSWVILSPIEQSIKQKIEAVGTPLKDWDIQINYGIKTGYNEAFIISTEKRDEILSNCQTADERERTAALIRPILRGRDIKRYGYDWAGLWVILAYNGIYKIMEKEYPAIYAHLSQYEDQLKKRGQCRYTASKRLRKDADYPGQHHWLELDNNPSLEKLDDFSKPKIMYSEIVQSPQFYLDKNGEFYPEATCFLLTGKDLEYLYRVVHSKIVTFVFKTFYAGGGLGDHGYRYKKAFFEKLPIPIWIGNNVQIEIMRTSIPTDIDSLIMQLYGLSIEEFRFIESR